MKIIVCVKQVPGTSKVAVDEKTGVLLRSGAVSKLNPYDLYALETALKLKEAAGGEIVVLTMGPPQAEAAVRECYALGADKGVMLSDRAFAGADVLATSYTLAGGVRRLEPYDIIICGKQTTDGDTAQVGPELAEFLDIPHMTNVTRVEPPKDGTIRVSADMGEYSEEFDIELPCLITVDKNIYIPRLPSYKRLLAYKDRSVDVLTLKDMEDTRPEKYGLDGSPTQVERIYPPEVTVKRTVIDGSARSASDKLYTELRNLKLV